MRNYLQEKMFNCLYQTHDIKQAIDIASNINFKIFDYLQEKLNIRNSSFELYDNDSIWDEFIHGFNSIEDLTSEHYKVNFRGLYLHNIKEIKNEASNFTKLKSLTLSNLGLIGVLSILEKPIEIKYFFKIL